MSHQTEAHARIQFGATLICWDCKKQLPKEEDQYQHLNLWPLCKGCAETREMRKVTLIRKMAARRPTNG